MLGGIAAWLGFTLPSAVALTVFGLAGRDDRPVRRGLGPRSQAGRRRGRRAGRLVDGRQPDAGLAAPRSSRWSAAAVALAWATPFSQVAIIAAGALVGRLLLAPPRIAGHRPRAQSDLATRTGLARPRPRSSSCCSASRSCAAIGQPVALFDAFYRSGALVFGGGHVVLPLLHATVVDPGWVSDGQFLAGYGAAQAVPGPLFTFAAFLGAVAGPTPNGVPGAAIATVAIFLPSFLLDLRGAAVLGPRCARPSTSGGP